MRKTNFLIFALAMTMVLTNCKDGSESLNVGSPKQQLKTLNDYVLTSHIYEDTSRLSPLKTYEFKLLNREGIQKYGLDINNLGAGESFAFLEVFAPTEQSLELVFSNGAKLYDDGKDFDQVSGDGIYTAKKIVKYKSKDDSNKQQDGISENGKISIVIDCEVDIIKNGNNCSNPEDADYTCDALLGYCYCIYNCSFEFTWEW